MNMLADEETLGHVLHVEAGGGWFVEGVDEWGRAMLGRVENAYVLTGIYEDGAVERAARDTWGDLVTRMAVRRRVIVEAL